MSCYAFFKEWLLPSPPPGCVCSVISEQGSEPVNAPVHKALCDFLSLLPQDDAPELLADLQSHHLVPRLAVLQMPPLPPPPLQAPTAVPTTQHVGGGGGGSGADGAAAAAAPAVAPAAAAAATGNAFSGVTRALQRIFPAPAASTLGHTAAWCAPEATLQQQQYDHAPASAGGAPADGSNHSPRVGRRPLAALETLVDLAEEAAARGEPPLWGWCRCGG